MRSGLSGPAPLRYLFACLVAASYFLFQFHYMPQFLDWDQVWYLNNIIDSLEPTGTIYFNPHHLHLEIGGKLFHQFVARHLGGAGFTDVVFNVRLRSLLDGSLGLLFAVLFLTDATGRVVWGVVGGLLIAFCHGYLVYTAKADTGIFALAIVFPLLFTLRRIERTCRFSLPLAVVAGALLFLAVMYHQFLVFAFAAMLISLLVPLLSSAGSHRPDQAGSRRKAHIPQLESHPRRRFLLAVIMTVIGGGLSTGAYLLVGKVCYNLPYDKADPSVGRGPCYDLSFQEWLFWYEAKGWWGTGLRQDDRRLGFRGLANAFLSPTGTVKYLRYSRVDKFEYDLRNFGAAESFPYNLTAVYLGLSLSGTLLFAPGMLRRYGRSFVFVLLSLAGFAVFASYWEPLYMEFWLIPASLLCILGVLFLNWVGERFHRFVGNLIQLVFSALVLFYALSLAGHNIMYYVIPYSQRRHTEDIDPKWPTDYSMKLFSTSIYRYPLDPYRNVKTMEPVR